METNRFFEIGDIVEDIRYPGEVCEIIELKNNWYTLKDLEDPSLEYVVYAGYTENMLRIVNKKQLIYFV